jgi:hypothetical protein
MKKRTKYILFAIIIILIIFNVFSIAKVSKKEKPSPIPTLNEIPILIYGILEPLGKSTSVSPESNGIVKEIYVSEGDEVKAEQSLCAIESASQDQSSLSYLTSPINGIVYKCDLHIGEAFKNGDNDRLILGSRDLQIRCDVEALWIGKIGRQKIYVAYNAETDEPIGKATFISASRYLRPKSFLTEVPGEKLANQYQEIIMDFKPTQIEPLPIGLPVIVKIRDNNTSFSVIKHKDTKVTNITKKSKE